MHVIEDIADLINEKKPFSEWKVEYRNLLLAAISPALDDVPEKGGFPEDMRKAFNLMRRLVPLSGPSRIPTEFVTADISILSMRNDDDVVMIRSILISKIVHPWTFVF